MSVCLNMIVKNEAHVIRRCLESHRHVIDHWVIVDTGSTDGTQDIIREVLAGCAGTLHELPWVDFAFNRTQALELAHGKADYILVNDADHTFHGDVPRTLLGDGYYIDYHYSGTVYGVACLLSDRLPWRYVGVVHEYVTCDTPHKIERLEGPYIEVFHEGARSRDSDTYKKDAAILQAEMLAHPDPRTAFYLAQSYRDANEPELALRAYLQRAEMAGWDQETWFARYQAAVLTEQLGRAPELISRAYQEAYCARPTRVEPLVCLAKWHREREEHALAYLYARQACELPLSTDILFVDRPMYDWRRYDELSVAAWYTDHKDDGLKASQRLIYHEDVPLRERARIQKNWTFYNGAGHG